MTLAQGRQGGLADPAKTLRRRLTQDEGPAPILNRARLLAAEFARNSAAGLDLWRLVRRQSQTRWGSDDGPHTQDPCQGGRGGAN